MGIIDSVKKKIDDIDKSINPFRKAADALKGGTEALKGGKDAATAQMAPPPGNVKPGSLLKVDDSIKTQPR